MSEKSSFWERRRMLAAGLVLTAGSAACSATVEGTASPHTSPDHGITIVVPTPEHLTSITVVPDFSKLRKDGLCMGGDPRPCFLPIRKVPDVNVPATPDTIINLINGVDEVQWPFEPHGASQGDRMKAVCNVGGKSAAINAEGGKSDTYVVIEAPRDKMSASAIAAAENAKNPPYGVVRDDAGYVQAVFGYAADMWVRSVDSSESTSQLAPCTPAQNPAGYPTF
jgi:hypothetical protein